MVARMADLLDQENLEELRALAHQMKGTGGFYGFDALTDAAALIEQQATGATDVGAVAAEVKLLIDLIRRVDGYDPTKESVAAQARLS